MDRRASARRIRTINSRATSARVGRRGSATLADGFEEQDRGRWDRAQIEEALPLVEEALRGGPGPYAVQAAIAAVHAQAPSAGQTDWAQIRALYDVLLRMQPSPVVELNRAAAQPKR